VGIPSRREQKQKRRNILAGALVLFALIIAPRADAASLYFSPASGTYRPGDTAAVEIRIDNQGDCINAAEINIGFPRDVVEVVDVSRGDSIFPIWIVAPTVKKQFGLITMVGGVPGGYCGRTPGDPSLTNVVAKAIIRFSSTAKNLPSTARLSILNTSQVVLNDGLGTPASVTFGTADFVLDPTGKPQPNAWTESLQNDKTPPEPFLIEAYRDRTVFEGRYFVVFSTVDKQTGLDRYEVAEMRERNPGGDKKDLAWKAGESPYVLEDQDLRSMVYVKAIDKAGNERIAEYNPSATGRPGNRFLLWLVGSATLLFIILRLVRLLPF
jgi:hypothetical protein